MATVFVPGTILVPNEITPNQAGLVDATSGALITGTLALPRSGEGGALLANGTMIFGNYAAGVLDSVLIYNPALGLVASPAVFGASWGLESPITSDFATTFYVSWVDSTHAGFAQVKSVSASGTVGGTTYTLAVKGLNAMAVSGTTLFYSEFSANRALRTWDLLGNVAGADFLPATPFLSWGAAPRSDMLVIPGTQTLLVIVRPNVTLDAVEVRRYDFSGAALLLGTYPMGDAALGSDMRLSLDLAQPSTYFWAHTFPDGTGDTSLLSQIEIATGNVIRSFTVNSSSVVPTKVPLSCPFFVWSGTTPTPDVPTRTDPIRRMRQAPHLSDSGNSNRIFYPGFQLLFEAGAERDDPTDPLKFYLQWSDDGGHAWSTLHEIEAGTQGQYRYRAIWRRLGFGRDRVFRVIDSNAANIVWMDAQLDPDPSQGDS